MNSTRLDQRGSVLIIAVIAMLILGILSFSFALLSRVEMTTGVNYKFQAQAEALAEAGLERGRDEVRTAADERMRVHAVDRPRQLVLLRVWRRAGQAALQRGRLGRRELLGGHRQRLQPPRARGDPGPELQRGVARPRHERDGGPHGLGDGGERPGTGPGAGGPRDRQPLEARLLELEPGQSARLLQRAGEPERKPERSCPRTRTSTRAARPRTTTCPGPSSGARRSTPTLHGETTGNCPPGQNYGYPYPGGKRLVVAGDRSKANCDGGGHPVPGLLRLRADHALPEPRSVAAPAVPPA